MPALSFMVPPQQLSLFDDLPVAHSTPEAPPTPLEPGPEVRKAATATVPTEPAAQVAAAPAVFQHPRSHRALMMSGHSVAYELRRSRRRSIGFVVGPDGLSVSAPRWVGQNEIEAALREKATWILRKLQEQRERSARLQATKVQWREGGSVPFLGETIIMVLDPRTQGAVLKGDGQGLPGVPQLVLHLGLPQTAEPDQIRDLVQSWLQRQAKRVFEERCTLYTQRLGVKMTRLSLSSANTRWGSARADGSIRLNWRLIHFGLPVIDYVVAHELAHLREMNHSSAFWDVVRTALPGFEAARGVLRRELLPLLD